MGTLQERRNAYLQNLGNKISSGEYGILENTDFSYYMFFGDRLIEKTKTIEEIINLKNEKWSYIGTCIVIITRNDDGKIDINIMGQF